MVTVRELARSQGFPDSFVFHSINDDVVTVSPNNDIINLWLTAPFFHLDAQANWKCGPLARCCCDWTGAPRGLSEKVAQGSAAGCYDRVEYNNNFIDVIYYTHPIIVIIDILFSLILDVGLFNVH